MFRKGTPTLLIATWAAVGILGYFFNGLIEVLVMLFFALLFQLRAQGGHVIVIWGVLRKIIRIFKYSIQK